MGQGQTGQEEAVIYLGIVVVFAVAARIGTLDTRSNLPLGVGAIVTSQLALAVAGATGNLLLLYLGVAGNVFGAVVLLIRAAVEVRGRGRRQTVG